MSQPMMANETPSAIPPEANASNCSACPAPTITIASRRPPAAANSEIAMRPVAIRWRVTRRPPASPRPPLTQPDREARRGDGMLHRVSEVAGHAVHVRLPSQSLAELGGCVVSVVTGSVEPSVDRAANAPEHRLEEREHGQGRDRHRDAALADRPGECRLEDEDDGDEDGPEETGHDRVRQRPADDPVDLEEAISQDRDRDRERQGNE